MAGRARGGGTGWLDLARAGAPRGRRVARWAEGLPRIGGRGARPQRSRPARNGRHAGWQLENSLAACWRPTARHGTGAALGLLSWGDPEGLTGKEPAVNEKIVIPSNEEVLDVTDYGDVIEVVDVGNRESARILSENPAFCR